MKACDCKTEDSSFKISYEFMDVISALYIHSSHTIRE